MELLNANLFNKINSEDSAYWLGFIAADGHVDKKWPRLSIELSIRDDLHLQKFCDLLGMKLKSRHRFDKRTGRTYHMALVRPYNTELITDLKNLGLGNTKEALVTGLIFDYIPDTYINHFIRGYFDGDGTVGKYKASSQISICGDLIYLEKLRDVIIEHTSILGRIHRQKNIHYLAYSGATKVIKLRTFMYSNATIYLDRKFEIFESLKQKKYKYIGRKGDYWTVNTETYPKRGYKCFKSEDQAVEFALSLGLDIYRSKTWNGFTKEFVNQYQTSYSE